LPAFLPCRQADVVDAVFGIVIALIALAIPFFAWKLMHRYMNGYRDETF
jgi:hypothetical protein